MRLADKTIMIAAWYRQWNQLDDVAHNHNNGLEGQIERITSVKAHVMKAKANSKQIIIMGEINIDMPEDVDQTLIRRTAKTLHS